LHVKGSGGLAMNKQITEHAKKIVERRIAGCKGCGGSGIIYDDRPEHYPREWSCLACEPLRKLEKIVCWHEGERGIGNSCIHACGTALSPYKDNNPIYTVQSLRKLLEDMGEWLSFRYNLQLKVRHALSECIDIDHLRSKEFAEDTWWVTVQTTIVSINVTSSDELMAQEVLEYFKEVVK
jgi:hypothetical protein